METNSTHELKTLGLLHKHECSDEVLLLMSFYLTLSSDGCKETFPANHGGDFKVQLDNTLDMRGQPGEVALVDMLYTGQAFPNMPIADNQVTLKGSGKPQFENDYFITFDQTLDLWLTFKSERLSPGSPGGRRVVKYADFYLPRQHYSWTAFVDTVKRLCQVEFSMAHVNLSETEFQFTEANKGLDNLFNMKISSDLGNLFGINMKYKQIHDHQHGWVYFKHPITKMPKPVADTSLLFYSPFAVNKSCKIQVEREEIFMLTPQYWTVNMFKRAINALGKKFPKSSYLSNMSIEEGSSPEMCSLVLTANKDVKGDREFVLVKFLIDFMTVFATSLFGTSPFNLLFTEPLKIPISIIQAEDADSSWKNYEVSKRLRNNYYPTIAYIVDELNEVLSDLKLDIVKQRNSSTSGFTFFSLKDGVIKFTGKDGFTVLLSSGILKLMNLPSSSW